MHQINAKEIMSHHLITVHMEDSLLKAYQLMQEHRFRHLPVVDGANEIIGVLSDRDVQKAMKTKRHHIDVECELDPKHRVMDFMSWPATIVGDDVSVIEISKKILHEKISAVLISSCETNKIRGIITTDDLIQLLVKILGKNPSLTLKHWEDLGEISIHL